MHPLDEALALEPLDAAGGRFRGRTHAGYANMVGPFGGVTAAQALAAVLAHPQRLGEPAALTVNFCAAIADGAFDVDVRPVRTSRSTQHWTLEFRQQGEVVLSASALTALRRAVWSADDQPMPQVPAPAAVAPPSQRGRVEWLNRYEMRFVEGGFPERWDEADQGASRTRLWVRDAPPRPIDALALAALTDVFFPRIWRRRAKPVPIGTVTLTSYFHADAAQLAAAGSGYLLGQAQAQAFRGGFFDQTAQLWSEAGVLLATSHQLVYYKE